MTPVGLDFSGFARGLAAFQAGSADFAAFEVCGSSSSGIAAEFLRREALSHVAIRRLGVEETNMREIKESDWKILRQLHSAALERFCKQILLEVERINSDAAKSFHQKYLDIYQALQRRDQEIAQTFNDLRRSTALSRLASLKARGLLTEDEFLRFSRETRNAVDLLLQS